MTSHAQNPFQVERALRIDDGACRLAYTANPPATASRVRSLGQQPCTWIANEHNGSGSGSGTEPSCVIATSKSGGGGKFNSWLLTIWIELPADYTCAADCWWKVRYNYPDESTDTTTWSAYIEGNPVRLIE